MVCGQAFMVTVTRRSNPTTALGSHVVTFSRLGSPSGSLSLAMTVATAISPTPVGLAKASTATGGMSTEATERTVTVADEVVIPSVMVYEKTSGFSWDAEAVRTIGPVGDSRLTPGGSVGSLLANGSMVTGSSAACRSFAMTSMATLELGDAVMTSATATGAGAVAGGTIPTWTIPSALRP